MFDNINTFMPQRPKLPEYLAFLAFLGKSGEKYRLRTL
jgi:hypothetical protein